MGKTWPLNSECKIYQADLTDGMSFKPSNNIDEVSSNPEALCANNQRLHQHGVADICVNYIGTRVLESTRSF